MLLAFIWFYTGIHYDCLQLQPNQAPSNTVYLIYSYVCMILILVGFFYFSFIDILLSNLFQC